MSSTSASTSNKHSNKQSNKQLEKKLEENKFDLSEKEKIMSSMSQLKKQNEQLRKQRT
jgi:hypothetical protein